MANLGGGFNSEEHKSNLFPEGRYRFLIHGSDLVDAKKDNVVIGTDWEFKLICISDPHKNRQLLRRMAYTRQSSSPNIDQQLQIGKAQIADICRAVSVLSPQDTTELKNKQFEADVKIKGDFNNLSKIKACLPGSQPAVVAATASAPSGWTK